MASNKLFFVLEEVSPGGFKNLIGVEDQNADTVKEECRTVSKSQYLDEKKNSAIVPDNYSAMRDPLSSLTLESICDEEYLLCEVDS